MSGPYCFGRHEVRPAERVLLVDGRPAALGARLRPAADADRAAVGKNELFDLVWPGVVVEENNLQVQIYALRKLFGPQAIATIPGRGYRFTAAPETSTGAAAEATPAPARNDAASMQSSTNLPAHLPPLIGRHDDLRALTGLLRDQALVVSVVGAGGIGKIRLAQAVADAVRADFNDGVWWVELAAVSDPAMVANAVAQALGIAVSADRPAAAALLAVLKPHSALLVLDNCEHVLDAVVLLVAALLHQCSRLRILVTSQETLRLGSEHVYRLGGLDVPAPGEPAHAESGAIALFIARALAADPRMRFDTLDQRDRTAVGLAWLQPYLPEQEAAEHAVHNLQDRGQPLRRRRQQ